MFKNPVRCVAAIAMLSVSAFAQNQFLKQADGGFGTRLNVVPTSVIPVALGFSFTMPGGNVVTDVDVHASGRIMEVGADTSDDSETVPELLAETATIMLRWDLNSFPAPGSDVYFATDGASVATFTWADVQFGFQPLGTAQAQLFDDGRIVYVFDSRIPMDDGIIGVSPGGGIANPGSTDLSAVVTSPLVSASVAVYEDFANFPLTSAMDLQSTAIEFVPNGPGGSMGWTVLGNVGVADSIPPLTTVAQNGGGCPGVVTPFTTIFTPDGIGGYFVVSGPSLFDANIGPSLGVISDDLIDITNLDLGFMFPFPGGVAEQFVQIDNNGRIIPASATAGGDFTPSVGDLEGDGHPMVCCWTDINVLAAGSGNIHFQASPASATFTWNGVTQFFHPNQGITHQIRLFQDGTVFITIEDYDNYNAVAISADDLLIGLSDGVTAGTPEINITSTIATNTPLAAYEYWDASVGIEPVDFLMEPILASLSFPALGENWDVRLESLPPTTNTGFILIGFAGTNLPLDVVGIPCSLNVIEATGPALVLPTGDGSSSVLSIPVPSNPVLISLQLFLQGVADGAPFAPFPLFFTNSIVGTIGL